MLTLRKVLGGPRHLVLPVEPVSPYRYVERLVAAAVVRSFDAPDVLEVGPGDDSIFRHLPPGDIGSATVLDYNPKVLEVASAVAPGLDIDTLHRNVDRPGGLEGLDRCWDVVVANAVLEHLVNDDEFVAQVRGLIREGGIVLCTTVLGPGLYNLWDHAVGHYRRYTADGLRDLFSGYSEVEVLQTSVAQEWARPLFFGRVRHLADSTLEENNWRFGGEHGDFGKPPFSRIFPVVRWLLPLYAAADWSLRRVQGGIAIVIARR